MSEPHPITRYPRPLVAVDLVVLTIVDCDLKLLLVRRKQAPFEGRWALPGGFVRVGPTATEQGEDLRAAAARELAEETGLPPGAVFFEQLYTFGRSGRDPRARVISVAWYALVRPDLMPFVVAGGDAADAAWFSLTELPEDPLAFDHSTIVEMALERVRGKIDDSNIAFELVPPTFTIGELRAVHEVIKGQVYDPGNFRRRFKRMVTDGVIERAPGRRVTPSKPAAVYRFTQSGTAQTPREDRA